MRWLALAILVAGCNQIFGVTTTKLSDAYIPDAEFVPPDAPDGDMDMVPDYADNCPGDKNKNQRDLDGDGVGDACDNCPLLANTTQDHGHDTDRVGDLCDPHPDKDKDCVLLFDSMHDMATFGTMWTVVADPADPAPAEVIVAADHVTLHPHPPYKVGIAASLPALAELQVRGHVTLASGTSVAILSSATTLVTGYLCQLGYQAPSYSLIAHVGGNASVASGGLVPPDPVSDVVLLRLGLTTPMGLASALGCRADYGVAVATAVDSSATVLGTGGPMIIATGVDFVIDGVEITQHLPMNATCPTEVDR